MVIHEEEAGAAAAGAGAPAQRRVVRLVDGEGGWGPEGTGGDHRAPARDDLVQALHGEVVGAGLGVLAERGEEVVADRGHRILGPLGHKRGLLERRVRPVAPPSPPLAAVEDAVGVVPAVVHVVAHAIRARANRHRVHRGHVVRAHVDPVVVGRRHAAAVLDVEPRQALRDGPPDGVADEHVGERVGLAGHLRRPEGVGVAAEEGQERVVGRAARRRLRPPSFREEGRTHAVLLGQVL